MECPICYEEFAQHKCTICLQCGTRICDKCYKQIVKSGRTIQCPTCRHPELFSVGNKIERQSKDYDTYIRGRNYNVSYLFIDKMKHIIVPDDHCPMSSKFDHEIKYAIVKHLLEKPDWEDDSYPQIDWIEPDMNDEPNTIFVTCKDKMIQWFVDCGKIYWTQIHEYDLDNDDDVPHLLDDYLVLKLGNTKARLEDLFNQIKPWAGRRPE